MKNKALSNRSFKYNGLGFYIAMFALPILQFCVFYIGVNFNSVLLAFKNYDAFSGTYSFAGFDNFKQFITNVLQRQELSYSITNSLMLWLIGLLVTPLSLLFSFYVAEKKFGYNVFRFFLFLPSMLSSIVMTIIFTYISSIGLTSIGFPDYLNNIDTQFPTIIFYNIWVGFGSGVILYSGAIGQVSTDMIEAARIDGASSIRIFISIIFPSIYSTISTFVIVGVAGIFTNQACLFNFYGVGAQPQSYTIGYYLFVQVVGKSGLATYPYAAAAGLILTAVAVPCTLLVKFLLEKFGPSED